MQAGITLHGVTDIILYGDARPEHAQAIEIAKPRGILCHCLEEGYLRPYRVTYERWGNNGNSRLCDISLARMARALDPTAAPLEEPGDGWGAYLLDLTKPGGMFLAREFIMRDGDTLYVTSAPFTKWMKVLQSIAPLVSFTGSARVLTTY